MLFDQFVTPSSYSLPAHIVLGLAVLQPHLLLVFQMPWSASWTDGIVIVISDTFKSPMTL